MVRLPNRSHFRSQQPWVALYCLLWVVSGGLLPRESPFLWSAYLLISAFLFPALWGWSARSRLAAFSGGVGIMIATIFWGISQRVPVFQDQRTWVLVAMSGLIALGGRFRAESESENEIGTPT